MHVPEVALVQLTGKLGRERCCFLHPSALCVLPRPALSYARPCIGLPAGLSQLTELGLYGANDFGGATLSALQTLTALQRLTLDGTTLTPAALEGVLASEEEAADEGEGGGGQQVPCLLPGLTYLGLTGNRLLRCTFPAQCGQGPHHRCLLPDAVGCLLCQCWNISLALTALLSPPPACFQWR